MPAPVHVLSRRYNARPLDCARCPADIDNVIVHYACTIKPWQRSRKEWERLSWCHPERANFTHPLCEPCLIGMTQRWFGAEDRMCAALGRAMMASSSNDKPHAGHHRHEHLQEWDALALKEVFSPVALSREAIPACANFTDGLSLRAIA